MTPLQTLLRLLSARERTASDLRARLARKGFPPLDIEKALARAVELGYVDDLRAARLKARRWVERGLPRAAIELALRDAGVGPAAIAATMAEAPEERQLAQAALVWRFRRRSPAPEKAARYLAGRGFDAELVADLVRELQTADGTDG
jgi:regulatory protein